MCATTELWQGMRGAERSGAVRAVGQVIGTSVGAGVLGGRRS